MTALQKMTGSEANRQRWQLVKVFEKKRKFRRIVEKSVTLPPPVDGQKCAEIYVKRCMRGKTEVGAWRQKPMVSNHISISCCKNGEESTHTRCSLQKESVCVC